MGHKFCFREQSPQLKKISIYLLTVKAKFQDLLFHLPSIGSRAPVIFNAQIMHLNYLKCAVGA